MKKRWLVLLGVLAFLATGILHAPADRLYAWTLGKQEDAPLRLFGVQGTVSSGGATRVGLNGHTVLNDLNWRLHPAWLLLLRLSATLESRQDVDLQLTVSRSPFGRTRINDLHLDGTVQQVMAIATPARLPVEGRLTVSLDSAQLEAGVPVQVDGLAELQNLAWTLAREPLVLGSYNANLTSDDKGLLAQLASGDAPLELSGEARLGPDRNWDLKLQIKPRPNAAPELLTLMRSFGQPDSGGWYHIRRNGQF